MHITGTARAVFVQSGISLRAVPAFFT